MPRKPFINSSEYPYSISARCINKEWFQLPIQDVWTIMEDQLFFSTAAFGIKIHVFVLMNNHFHMIATAPNGNLSAAMNYFMRETSRTIARETDRINQIWGGRFYRCLINSHHYYLNAYKYIYRNPVDAGLVKYAEQYPYSTLHRLIGGKPLYFTLETDMNLFSDMEGTIRWLNITPTAEDLEAVRLALRKRVFKLPRNESNKKPHRLSIELL